MLYIKKLLRFILAKVRGKTVFKQELLLIKALKEKGINRNGLKIECDHDLGLNYVNGIEFGIKYPDSFFFRAVELTSKSKKVDFYFNGYVNKSGGRDILLEPFRSLPRSSIIASSEGRADKTKDIFNLDYFESLAQAKFGLCPHQLDWPGSKEHLWTYRFIEACFVGCIPVSFRATPLGENFTKDYYYVYDDEVLDNFSSTVVKYGYKEGLANQALAKKQFCFTDAEIERIILTL